ncbi:MAG: indolepyruvate oxidoreductase subunit beta [Bacteroidales bacterium]|jgi:indolepyruvate ferredoxin oxidoreductase beta subunit|nr:indolepyruvate oxidoreductase subunit beta [Bacteroidales bacterium]MBQ2599246.1 indolepyruvate oxidoreductase subunit beta [Bacteroidales bacterium]
MKQDIILAGVGGQGILSIATVIGSAALEQGLHLKQAEVHGMSQRGGDVQSNLRLSSDPIFSDLIPRGAADLVVSLEPLEALRYIPFLAPEGWIITNTVPFENIPDYPPMDQVMGELNKLPRVIAIDVDAIAKEVGSPRSANMVLLGATAAVLHILDPEKLRAGIRKIFGRKGEAVVEANIKAFDAGLASAQKK